MDRYRTTLTLDDPPMQEGDTGLIGVNEYDTRENLQPGQCQAAVNIDFSAQNAATRGGFVCLPELGVASFNVSSGWTQRTSAADRTWLGVAYGNGRFVAVGYSALGVDDVMYSLDEGTTWTLVSTGFGSSSWRSVTYGNGLFVAVGDLGTGNRVMTSPDGVAWTRRTSAADLTWTEVIWSGTLFVAVCNSVGGSTSQVMTSPDGITWTQRSTGTSRDWDGLVYGNSTYVACSSGGGTTNIMWSSDAITWTQVNTGISNNFQDVAYGNGRFVSVGSSGSNNQAMSSDDNGLTWTQRATLSGAHSWSTVTYGNGLFVACNSSGVAATAIMTSPDGITWTAAAAPTSQDWRKVTYGGNTFVATPLAGQATLMTKSFATTPNTTGTVLASGVYSDPNDAGSRWVMLVGTNEVGFYAFGRSSRSVPINSSYTVSVQSTVVQCNNLVYILRGDGNAPLYWNGAWEGEFTISPTPTPPAGFSNIPSSNQATFFQNRLWVIDGKDTVAASDVLSFDVYDDIANSFNLNTGSSDYLVTTYPFGDNTLVVFKNNSILALNNVSGSLIDVTATEITRTVGCVGINAVTSVGPDLVYVSDRNINLLSLTSTNNALQHKTLPLSRNIKAIWARVNWEYGDKISLAFWDNKLFVALPLDQSTTCNSVVVYNFITDQWYGEWNFDSAISMNIQGWVIAYYLGEQRLHCITEDGRIFVTNEGSQDISGTTVKEITTSVTTRAYRMNNDERVNRRMTMDYGTWRPTFSVTAYVGGASESEEILSDQTYSRSTSWIYQDSTYSLTNSGDNYNRAGRQDYAGLCSESIQPQSGFQPEMLQDYRLPLITRRRGRLAWYKVDNTQGKIVVYGIGSEARPGDRSNRTQVI